MTSYVEGIMISGIFHVRVYVMHMHACNMRRKRLEWNQVLKV